MASLSVSSIEQLSNADQERVAAIVEKCMLALEEGAPLEIESLVAEHRRLEVPLRRCLASLQTLHDAVHGLNDTIPNHSGCEIGGRLGDFVLQNVIGRGGMGVVYLATQVSLDRKVALKVLPSNTFANPKRLKRFLLEAQAAAQLQHPNIVPVFAVGEDSDVYYYAMLWVDGRSLDCSDSIAWPRNDFEKLVAVGIDVAFAIQHAHDCGIVHRDIKPSNLLLDKQGKVWITDFGLAHRVRDSGMTLSGELVGTANYMSPEQAIGRPVDERTDIYSLGATLYELATGHQAFSGSGLPEVLRKIERDEPVSPHKLTPSIPLDLETIICKAMSKDREDRYATSQELALDLIAFREGRPIQGRRPNAAKTLGRFLNRHMRLVIVGLLGLSLSLVATMVGMTMVWNERNAVQAALAQSQENYWRGRKLLDRWNEEFLPQLSVIPGTDFVRSEMLSDAVQYYEAFLASTPPNDPHLPIDADSARLTLAGAYSNLGNDGRAIENFQRAIANLTDRMETLNPSNRRSLYVAHNDLGLLFLRGGFVDQAIVQLKRAIQGHAELRSWNPKITDFQANEAAAHLNLAQAYQADKDNQNELAQRRIAEGLYRDLVRAHVDVLEYRSELATLLDHRAVSLATNNLTEAVRVAEEAMQLHSTCIVSDPRMQKSQARELQRLGASLHNLAVLESQSGLVERCVERFHHAIAVRDKLSRLEPNRIEARHELATSYSAIGMVESKLSRWSDSKENFSRATAILQDCIDGSDVSIDFKKQMQRELAAMRDASDTNASLKTSEVQ